MEALKAQAIVCRTYALNACIENKSKDYDATSDIYSQVYGGRTSERFRTNNAVQETRGLVLTYKDKVFSAYYHATCGGHTEDASLLWDIDIVPLKGVPCGFCKDSPHFNWHYVLSIKELEEKLKEAGIKALKINDVIVLGRDKSGRVTDLKVACGAKDIIISAKDLRSAIGPNIIRSTNFTLRIEKQDVVFEGFGWGHGVGLCQWGAYFMAKAGHNYKKILEYYYPQTNVKTTRF
jgi:stage II sporulation protein D